MNKSYFIVMCALLITGCVNNKETLNKTAAASLVDPLIAISNHSALITKNAADLTNITNTSVHNLTHN